ncbi:hypothetical protein ACOI9X_02680 [Pseudomonas sp. P2757]|uniref:hypothetical protein n=1 Tax=unclassified Pseudomonas TaxID=196821 RepID=UPI003B5BD1AD
MNFNFVINGAFIEKLKDWLRNDRGAVNHYSETWHGNPIDLLAARNEGEAWQVLSLLDKPVPFVGKAEYWLRFWYEVKGLDAGKYGIVQISGAKSGVTRLELHNSRRKSRKQKRTSDGPEAVELTEYEHKLVIAEGEEKIELRVMSPANSDSSNGNVRFTFAEVLLELENLVLKGLTVDGITQVRNRVPLCIGGNHMLAFDVEDTNAWTGTEAALVVTHDPDDVLRAAPAMEFYQPINKIWQLYCADTRADEHFTARLAIRSKYTAELYPLRLVCGHFRLYLHVVEESKYFPVIDLSQSAHLTMEVRSHFTLMPLANREVTFRLDDTVLLKQDSDALGRVTFSYTPTTVGDKHIIASVSSFYRPDLAEYTFIVQPIQSDPWTTAKVKLDVLRELGWGSGTIYLNRGATHDLELLLADNILDTTDVTMLSESVVTPGEVGVVFTPDINRTQQVVGNSASWRLACENRRNGEFTVSLKCVKLLEPSPRLTVDLDHNWKEIVEPKVLTRFPVEGGTEVRFSALIQSRVPGVGGLPNTLTHWSDNGAAEVPELAGPAGNIINAFKPGAAGPAWTSVKIANPYDGVDCLHRYEYTVFDESAWAVLAELTLDGRKQGSVGLLCFRNTDAVELKIEPRGELLIGEVISVELSGETGDDLQFVMDPEGATPRQMTADGLTYMVSSTSPISGMFRVQVNHHSLDPDFKLDPDEQVGRLLSTVLAEEATPTFDDRVLLAGDSIWACLGGLHRLRIVPLPNSPMVGLTMTGQLQVGDDLQMKLTAENQLPVPSSGKVWDLDARASTQKGNQGIGLSLEDSFFSYPLYGVPLDHNRIVSHVEEPNLDLQVNESVRLYLNATSYYSNLPVAGVPVTFVNAGDVKTSRTNEAGDAQYAFKALAPGEFQVLATALSPYDATPPVKTFTLKVIGTSQNVTPSIPTVPKKNKEKDKVMPAIIKGQRVTDGIIQVFDPAYHPEVGQSVRMAVRVAKRTRMPAENVSVLFETQPGQTQVRVVTDSEGMAEFVFKATAQGKTQVTALVEGSKSRAASHTFEFPVVKAGIWNDASLTLNTDTANAGAWGAKSVFPRSAQSHSVTLKVAAGSDLLNYQFRLGVVGESSLTELGITSVSPALGQPLSITGLGLSWTLITNATAGGTYSLVLSANKLMNQSPANHVSLGPTPPAPASKQAKKRRPSSK